MSDLIDGGPAFPSVADGYHCEGMSLRDYFAGIALQGWAANGQLKIEMKEDGPFGSIANWCYEAADAMLEARREQ